jgi:hypothetical protein
MKRSALLWTCVLGALLAGCYSHENLTKESPVKAGVEVSFRLHDGSRVISTEYQRADSGYSVTGKLLNKDNSRGEPFSGFIADRQIREIVTNTFSPADTGLAVLLVLVGSAAFIQLVISLNHVRFF